MSHQWRAGDGGTRSEPVPADAYSTDYFLTECEGHREYRESLGACLSQRLIVSLDAASITSGDVVLDLGCGRGEAVRHCAQRGALVYGVDYSAAALELARAAIDRLPAEVAGRAQLQRADAKCLPFRDNSFDRVLMLDIVEHLHPWELHRVFVEVRRVLKPTGFLLVHTMPNRWYYVHGYPIYRRLARLTGTRLPENPRQRWRYVDQVHINEQDICSLSASLAAAGFRSRVWLHHVESASRDGGLLVAAARSLLARLMPFKLVFCNDIFAIATPDDRAACGQDCDTRLRSPGPTDGRRSAGKQTGDDR